MVLSTTASSAKGLVAGAILLSAAITFISGARAAQFNLSVVDQDNNPFNGFRYLVQEDCMFLVDPQAADPTPQGEQAFNFHRSHCHALRSGRRNGNSAVTVTDLPDGMDCFVSALPNTPVGAGFQTGGARVPGCITNTTVIIPNMEQGFQTAQISYKVFEDGVGGGINNQPDVGEHGLAGFSFLVEDAAGQVQQDAFGNLLGTDYQIGDDCGNPEGVFCLGTDGLPVIKTYGTGEIVTDDTGEGVIKFLAPGKYGIITVPPTGENWLQTTTIEGTKVIDAWVAPGNGNRLVEFGPALWHVFYGWTRSDLDRRAELGVNGNSTITGQVRRGHPGPPPEVATDAGPAFIGGQNGFCYVGVNTIGGVSNEGTAVAQCDAEGNFEIGGLAPGTYELAIWDKFLDIIIAFQTVIIPNDGDTVALGDVTVPMWFAGLEHNVFFDLNEDAIWDANEPGINEQATNTRFRDGTIYQSFPTDGSGFVPYEETFPFFHWLVAEVDYARFKPTGVTITNDLGGTVQGTEGGDPVDDYGEGKRNPETFTIESYAPGSTEGSPVLLQAFQAFQGQNLRFDWGKQLWPQGENGGIAGIVYYAATRAEDDPEKYAAEPWEPGIPDVQVALFAGRITNNGGERPENVNGIAGIQQPDQDNWPLGNFPGPEDINRCDTIASGCTHVQAGVGYTADFDYGDAIDIVWTDSWDASQPTDCTHSLDPALGVPADRCMDGLSNWNQIKDGVFDGGYAFGAGTYTNPTGNFPSALDADDEYLGNLSNYVLNNFTQASPGHLPGGDSGYVVQVYPPRSATHNVNGVPIPIYLVSESQDKNVDFGPDWVPSTAALPEAVARCTGGSYTVPDQLALFPSVDAPLAGQTLQRCNQKFQFLADSGEAQLANNSVVDFYLHTEVPLAAKAVGQITDDLATEAAQGKPTSTEKFAPGFMSMAFFDYSGKEIHRGYSSEFSKFNFQLPSTVSQSLPIPSGISPMMHRFCLNHPGPIEDPNNAGSFITDPNYDPRYSTTCYTFDFMPGKTTYLDTPVIRLAAFVGPLQAQTDCMQPNHTPVIKQVITSDYNGPAVTAADGTHTVTIMALGDTEVPDPASNNPNGTLTRDFGFGNNPGTVTVGGVALTNVAWTAESITGTVPVGMTTGQLVVNRANGSSTRTGVTVHVAPTGTVTQVLPGPGQPIQAAVDGANDGDLILVTPGTYDENVIVYKEVKIQGAGAPSTQIFAAPFSLDAGAPQLPGQSDKLQAWRNKLAELDGLNLLGFLPDQDHALPSQDAPGFLVIPNNGVFGSGDGFTAQIDGFQVQGANLGGAFFVNANADGLTISNNRAIANLGQFGGGIRIGNPLAGNLSSVGFIGGVQQLDPSDLEGVNPNITIAYNEVIQNASFYSGGGVAIYTGADDYLVTNNLMCGNFSREGGGGLTQVGRVGPRAGNGSLGGGNREDGVVRDNQIIFNEVFQGNQAGGGGGGIELAGEDPVALGTASGLTEGTGSITIDRNQFHGNLGGAAPGGAISLKGINGEDVANNGPSLNNQNRWHRILVLNNLVSNNVGGQWGAGINLSDAVRVDMIHNTIARNDNASVAASVRDATGNFSDPYPSGLAAQVHSPALAAVMATQTAVGNGRMTYSAPRRIWNNIFDRNRSFHLDRTMDPVLQPDPAASTGSSADPVTWDMGVVGTASVECLDPRYSLITLANGPDGCAYDAANRFNVIRDNTTNPPRFSNPLFLDLLAATAADEGGNDTQLYFTPLTLVENEATPTVYDYHIRSNSAAAGISLDQIFMYAGQGNPLAVDVDQQTRPTALGDVDAGADQVTFP